MLRVNIYIPQEMDDKVAFLATHSGIKKAEVVRKALKVGLETIENKHSSAQNLLDLTKEMTSISTIGTVPKDIVKNLDFYTWGGVRRG